MQLQVVSFIQRLPGCREQASVFREEVSGVCPDPVLQIPGVMAGSSDLLSCVIAEQWHLGGSLSMELSSTVANCILLL